MYQLATQLSEFEARIAAQEDRIADLVLRAPMDGIILRKDGVVRSYSHLTGQQLSALLKLRAIRM